MGEGHSIEENCRKAGNDRERGIQNRSVFHAGKALAGVERSRLVPFKGRTANKFGAAV